MIALEHDLAAIATGPLVKTSMVGFPEAIANAVLAWLVNESAASVAVRVKDSPGVVGTRFVK